MGAGCAFGSGLRTEGCGGLSLAEVGVLAIDLARVLAPGDVVFLYGAVGVGKTTLCRYIVEELSSDVFLGSPTFPIVQEYKCFSFKLYHVDLYRIKSLKEVYGIGLFDLIDGNIALIEWPEILGDAMVCTHRVRISQALPETRYVQLELCKS